MTSRLSGYMRRDDITIRPDGTEHEILLTPALDDLRHGRG